MKRISQADQIGREWNMSLRPGALSTCMLGCSVCSTFTSLRWASRSSLEISRRDRGRSSHWEPVDGSDYRETAIVFQPVDSQFAQVNFTFQFQLRRIVFCQYLQHGKQVDGMACHRSGAQVAEGWIGTAQGAYFWIDPVARGSPPPLSTIHGLGL